MLELNRSTIGALIATVAIAMGGSALAQDAADTTASSGEQTQADSNSQNAQDDWANPPRIANIEDESERVRALSVLIGQSYYGMMPKAEDAQQEAGLPRFDETMERHLGTADADRPKANIHNINEIFDEDVAEGLRQSAEANAAQIGSLHEIVETEESLVQALEENDLGPEDIVGAQINADGSIDLYVIPDWMEN